MTEVAYSATVSMIWGFFSDEYSLEVAFFSQLTSYCFLKATSVANHSVVGKVSALAFSREESDLRPQLAG